MHRGSSTFVVDGNTPSRPDHVEQHACILSSAYFGLLLGPSV